MQKKSSATSIKHTHTPYIFIRLTTSSKYHSHTNWPKNRQNNFKYINPSSPYLEKASRISQHLSKWVLPTTKQIHDL